MIGTFEDGPPLPLLLGVSPGLAVLGEGRLEHEGVDVVVLLEVGLAVLELGLLEVWGHVGHLDVG